ncbi:MAG: substrate-binding domain-containing protein, partial [Planctomycetota bacterium]|nr:substrate-binding domain-containing protein [Planctomycetota bacterium]
MTRLVLAWCLAALAFTMPAPAGENFRIGVCVMGTRHAYFRDMLDEITMNAEKAGVTVLPGDADFDHARQVAVLEGFIQEKVDLIMVAPYDARQLVPTLEHAGAAGIPVISLDSPIGGYPCISHCGSDNAAGGRLAAGMMLEHLGERELSGG